MQPTAYCHDVRLDLVTVDGELCGLHGLTAHGSGIAVPQPYGATVRGRTVGNTTVVVLRDARAAHLLELRREGGRLRAHDLSVTGDGAAAWDYSFAPARDTYSADGRAGVLRDACVPHHDDPGDSGEDVDVHAALEADPLSVSFQTCTLYAGSAAGLPVCYRAELERLRTRHAYLLSKARRRFESGAGSEGQDLAASSKAFEDAERAWNRYREFHCASLDAAFGLGNARGVDGTACRIESYLARIEDLESLSDRLAPPP